MSKFFGIKTPKIQFHYLIPPIRLLASGANGFVNELVFQRGDYKVATILKSAMRATSDSLYYEAYVGRNYINHLNRNFPLFLETYGALQYKPDSMVNLKYIVQNPNVATNTAQLAATDPASFAALFTHETITEVPTPLPITPNIIAQSCVNSANNAILIQYLHEPLSVYRYMQDTLHSASMSIEEKQYIAAVELPTILFQVYAVLAALSKEFTHYDLHTDNVLLYRLPNNQYIRMNYHNNTGGYATTTSFLTRYIAKVIDYGRIYCPLNQAFFEAVCAVPQCESAKSECGGEMGYTFFPASADYPPQFTRNSNYTTRLLPNASHDLRLAVICREFVAQVSAAGVDERLPTPILSILATIVYEPSYVPSGRGKELIQVYYGTPPMESKPGKGRIQNVMDLYYMLREMIGRNKNFDALNRAEFAKVDAENAGTLDVWIGRDDVDEDGDRLPLEFAGPPITESLAAPIAAATAVPASAAAMPQRTPSPIPQPFALEMSSPHVSDLDFSNRTKSAMIDTVPSTPTSGPGSGNLLSDLNPSDVNYWLRSPSFPTNSQEPAAKKMRANVSL